MKPLAYYTTGRHNIFIKWCVPFDVLSALTYQQGPNVDEIQSTETLRLQGDRKRRETVGTNHTFHRWRSQRVSRRTIQHSLPNKGGGL